MVLLWFWVSVVSTFENRSVVCSPLTKFKGLDNKQNSTKTVESPNTSSTSLMAQVPADFSGTGPSWPHLNSSSHQVCHLYWASWPCLVLFPILPPILLLIELCTSPALHFPSRPGWAQNLFWLLTFLWPVYALLLRYPSECPQSRPCCYPRAGQWTREIRGLIVFSFCVLS